MATSLKDVRQMLGLSLHGWENAMVVFLIIAGLFALIAGVATWAVVRLQRAEIANSERELQEYRVKTSKDIADANAAGEVAKTEAARANEAAAKLNNETARLTAENLALQTVMLPRHVGLIGIDEQPKAATWFAGFNRWAGVKILIQVVPGDPEAQNLANEIAIVLAQLGWHPEFISEKRSGVSLNLSEGISVLSPASHKPWDPKDEAQLVFQKIGEAAASLAKALTSAGLGVGPYPVSGTTGSIVIVDYPPGSEDEAYNPYRNFSPPLDGVLLQVGSRPISRTLQWIKQGRPDASGNRPANTVPADVK